MIPCRVLEIDRVREKIMLDILNWSSSKEKVLNLVTVPYNSSIIFMEIILKYVLNKQKVLYITNEDSGRVDILDCLKRHSSFRDYTYVRNNKASSWLKSYLYVTDHLNAMNLIKDYDLVIYDDVRALSSYSKYEILDLMATFCKENTKIICRAAEAVFQNATCIDIPVKDSKLPLPEPRIITTRIDVNKEIPYVVYEYLVWSIDSDRKVIIYVPDEEKGENVYRYLLTFKENLHNNIMYFRDDRETKTLTNFLKNKRGIIIINNSKDLCLDLKNTDIMVYFADDKTFHYKKLLYYCSKVGRDFDAGNGEVIFVARESSKDMEIAKNITRSFNKQAWESGLLKV